MCTLFSERCSRFSVPCTMFSVHFLYTVLCTFFSTLFSVPCFLCDVLCTCFCILFYLRCSLILFSDNDDEMKSCSNDNDDDSEYCTVSEEEDGSVECEIQQTSGHDDTRQPEETNNGRE